MLFICTHPECTRREGFSNTNDLEIHTKTIHPQVVGDLSTKRKFRCLVPGCRSKDEGWQRLDDFQSHLESVHQHGLRNDEEMDDIRRRGTLVEGRLVSGCTLFEGAVHRRVPSLPLAEEDYVPRRAPRTGIASKLHTAGLKSVSLHLQRKEEPAPRNDYKTSAGSWL